ncbi:putative mannan endo-1,6-alpha-mannosidase [Martiniozyma asiatica (nom. inval.)]|nr:putative mannan endo-1,6-alpha-mannosidase [Martiniozyma asiatica]
MQFKTLVSVFALLGTISNALELIVGNQESVCDAATLITNGMMDYYLGIRYGGAVGMFQAPYYWWEAGEAFGGMIDTWFLCKNTTYESIIYDALIAQRGSNYNFIPSNQSTTEGNDDQGFWGLASMEAAERNFTNPPSDEPGWVALTQAVYNTMLARWDDESCGGGLRWQIFQWNSGYDYKNTISNSCLFALSARLARYTSNDTYAETANMTLKWLLDINFIVENDDYLLVYDGANIGTNNCSTVHKESWTYNYGLMLAGSAYLYNHTNDDYWLNYVGKFLKGIENKFVNSTTGILAETTCQSSGNCNNDQRSFKSILSRCLGQAAQLVPQYSDEIMKIIDTSAAGAAQSCSGGTDGHTCGINWSYGSNDNWYGLGEQMSALEIIQNTLIMQAAAPLTNSTGGTSKGNANAGLNTRESTNTNEITVSTKDKAGAGILTAVVLIIFISLCVWMAI